MSKKKKTKHTLAETYRIRYQMYRDLGYTATEAQKLRSHAVDVTKINIRKDGSIIKGKNYRELKNTIDYENYRQKASKIKVTSKSKLGQTIGDTIYSQWGTLTQDNRYKEDTARMAHRIQKQYKVNNKQAYYILWYATTQDTKKSFSQIIKELRSSKEFEIYAHSYTGLSQKKRGKRK